MKIGHISYAYKPVIGGQEVYISNLIEVLKDQGHSQRVYQSDVGIEIASPELVLIPKLPKIMRYKATDIYAYNLFLLSKYKELKKEDVLIVHYAFHYPVVSWHKNVIIVSHGVEWEVPPIRLNHKIRKIIAKITYKSKHCKLVANDTDYFRQMRVNINPARGVFEEIDKDRWFIPNCVDTSRFCENEGLEKLKRLNPILVPRNIVHRRGIDLAIKAFSLFVKKYPDTNLVIVGSYNNCLNPVYKNVCNIVKNLNLEKKIIFWGSAPWTEMPKIYYSSLMTVIPSIFGEGTSLSALESMACGITTVSTNVGGLADLPCVLASPDYKNLAETMIESFNDRKQIGQKQKDLVAKTYNHNNWKNTWIKVLLS